MNHIDIVKNLLSSYETGDIKNIASVFTEDFVFSGPVPVPMGKRDYVGLMTAVVTAFPDWKWNVSDYQEKGDKVTITVHISGTHSATLALPMLPQPVPATHKHFQLPAETLEAEFDGDKVCQLKSNGVSGGGLMGILQQIGIRVPVA